MTFRLARLSDSHYRRDTRTIMLLVILAALPGLLTQCYFFGWGTCIQLILAIITALFCEGMILSLRHFSVKTGLQDNSALLTALLLAVSIPPVAPWWMIILGTAFAIIIAKQLYGGLGQNPFNPAMVGYVVLLISFPVQMTSWLPPDSLQLIKPGFFDVLHVIFYGDTLSGQSLTQLQQGIDGISQATPLDHLKTSLHTGHTVTQVLQDPIYHASLAGIGWQWVNVAYLMGGIFLLWTRTIQWQIPMGMLASLALCSFIGWFLAPQMLTSPLIHLFSGATMIGAFFIATDPVTASTTKKGRIIFGALIGSLVWLIRSFGGYPDAVAFAVLLANIAVPLIDYYTQPTVYGHNGK